MVCAEYKSFYVFRIPPARCAVCGSFNCKVAYPFCTHCGKEYAKLLVEGCADCGKRPVDCDCFKVANTLHKFWLFSYKGKTTRRLFYALKRRRALHDFAYFARRLAEQIVAVCGEGVQVDCVCYVPRSKQGVDLYGYDHARLLALQLAKLFGVECRPLIAHTGAAGEQKRLSRQFRGTAAKTRYCANERELTEGLFPYRRVLLADDIVTTGTTMGECAYILKQHGVKQVFCAFIAHTPNKNKR